MNLVLLGLPGAGKGTQAKKVADKYLLPHIATGDIFRKEIRDETQLGKIAKEYIDSGKLVPDEITINIVKKRLQQDDCQHGFIMDGFPRTLHQAQVLNKMLSSLGRELDLAIYLDVEEELVIRRITGRRVCEDCGAAYHVEFNPPKVAGVCDRCGGHLTHRSDDQEDTVRKRIEINKDKIDKISSYYQKNGVLEVVHSVGGIKQVFKRITEIIEERRVK